MTIANFTDLVASFSNRLAALFVTENAQDVILASLNDVRRDAQRRHVFNMAKRNVFAQLSMKPASLLSDFKADPSGAGATVVVRRLDALFEYGTQTVAATTCYYPTAPLDVKRSALIGQSNTAENMWAIAESVPGQLSRPAPRSSYAYLVGTDVYHSQLTSQTWYLGHAVAMLPDLGSGDSPDFFLTYHTDWLRYAVLMHLNNWLSDNNKLNISVAFVDKLWQSVTNFDAQQATAATLDLD